MHNFEKEKILKKNSENEREDRTKSSLESPFIFLCTDTHRYWKKGKSKKKKNIKTPEPLKFYVKSNGKKEREGGGGETRCLASSQFHFPPSEYPVDWIYKRNDISNIKIDDGWIFTIVTRGQDEEREFPSVEISRESFGVSPPSPRLITRG